MADKDPTTAGQDPSDEDRRRTLAALDPDVLDECASPPRRSRAHEEIHHLGEEDLPSVDCDVCGRPTRPWDLVEADNQQICDECVGSMRPYRPVRWQVIGVLAAAAVVLLTVAGSFTIASYRAYLTSPAYALDVVRGAIARKDAAALDAHCDVRAMSLQIRQACARRGEARAMPVFVASFIASGLTSARVSERGTTTATAIAAATVPETGSRVPIRFQMVLRSDPSGDRWVVTRVANIDQIAAEFYK